MPEPFRKLIALVDRADRTRIVLLMILMMLTALAQAAGVVSIMPFLAVVADPSLVDTNRWLNLAYQRLGFESTGPFLYFLAMGALVVFIGGLALQALTRWLITRFSFMQHHALSHRIMADYMQRPWTFFLGRNTRDLTKTALLETGQAVNGALMPAMTLLSAIMLATATIAMLVWIDPWLALGVAAVLGLVYGAIYAIARPSLQTLGSDRAAANRERFMAAANALEGIKEIRLLGREGPCLARFEEPSRRLARCQAGVSLLQSLPQYAIEAAAFGGLLLVVAYLVSGSGGLAHALPLIGVYALAGKRLIPAFQAILSALASIRFNMAAVESLLVDLEPRTKTGSPPRATGIAAPRIPRREIGISHLCYRYPGTTHPALDDLCLRVPAGTTVGIIGASGAGKSTLIDLMLGLLRPDAGRITIDDSPLLFDEDIRRWQAALGYVPQHIFLADQSVAANIALGLPEEDIDAAAVERAARLANLHDFVTDELARGYETEIGDRGVRLSGGQRQRLGIARALYRDPAVLLFDEATSSLDNSTERVVMEAIHGLAGEKTILLVAHRLTTVRSCDQICVLDQGRLVEQGTWEELSLTGPHFRGLASGR